MWQLLNSIQQIAQSDSVGLLEGVGRHLGWQVRRILNRFPCELTISRSRLLVERPNGVAALVNAMGMYDFHNMSLIQALLRSRRATFVDIGANIGTYTLVASEIGTARVVSIEPHPQTFAMLEENVRLNGRSNVLCFNFAVSERDGYALLTDQAGRSTNRIVDAAEDGQSCLPVPCRTMDAICRQLDLEPDIVKIDIEGHEAAALAGFHEFLHRTRVILIEGGDRPLISAALRGAGLWGPLYFHRQKASLLPFAQRRPEDPAYVGEKGTEWLETLGIGVQTKEGDGAGI